MESISPSKNRYSLADDGVKVANFILVYASQSLTQTTEDSNNVVTGMLKSILNKQHNTTMSVKFPDVLNHLNASDPMLNLIVSSTIQKLSLYHKLSLHKPAFQSTVNKAVGVIIVNSSYKYRYTNVEETKDNLYQMNFVWKGEESKQKYKKKRSKQKSAKKSAAELFFARLKPPISETRNSLNEKLTEKPNTTPYKDDSINVDASLPTANLDMSTIES